MRQEFVPFEIEGVKFEEFAREHAWNTCPWAAIIVSCSGGAMAFESVDDGHRWLDETDEPDHWYPPIHIDR